MSKAASFEWKRLPDAEIRRRFDAGVEILCANAESVSDVLRVVKTGLVQLTYLHDDACTPDRCCCKPEYIIQKGSAESWRNGVAATRDWVRSCNAKLS
jgi:hypothetical protein